MKIYHVNFCGHGTEDKEFTVTARSITEAERKARVLLLSWVKKNWEFRTMSKWETDKVEWVDTIDS